jgi:Flp pilus assembly protein TadG
MSRSSRILGIAAVEMVITLPLILLLLTPVAELGRAFIQYSRLSHRVQAGARFVADNAYQGSTGVPVLTQQVRQQAINLVLYGRTVETGTDPLAVPELAESDLFIDVSSSGLVTLSANYTYRPMIAGLLPVFGFGDDLDISTLKLQPRAVMRAL